MLREFTIFFWLQFLSYLNITIDYRAVAHEQYAIAAITNMLAPVIAWTMVRRVSQSQRPVIGGLAVALGGACATLVGMWLTRMWQ